MILPETAEQLRDLWDQRQFTGEGLDEFAGTRMTWTI